MTLRLYNTLTRSLDEFRPIAEGRVGVYACGPTVYRPPHVGNFRTFLFNDLLHRYLEWKGLAVTFVMNLTDVEDKIITEAASTGVPIADVTAPVTAAFEADLRTLNVRPVDVYPRATEHIPAMVSLVGRLLERGHAYRQGGTVYFDISSFPQYGKLARIEADDIRAGAGLATRAGGIDADEYEKADARDFALWKAAKDEDRRAGAVWPTPWGEGRPGWHIECSAMSMQLLGETFDIHTGGEDLVFPHHEDEIAQSEGATGRPFVHYWLHVKHLLVNGEKMSKSKRNDYTIAQLVEMGHQPSAIRYLLLSAQYRKELNFSFDGLDAARHSLQRLLDFERRLDDAVTRADAPLSALPRLAEDMLRAYEAALDDDLNTPNALAALFDFVRDANAELGRGQPLDQSAIQAARAALQRVDDVLGVLALARAESTAVDDELGKWVELKIEERRLARDHRDFSAADRIRAELAERGVVLEDTPQGTRWRRA